MLIDEVQALVDAGALNRGQGNSLIVKLEGALKKLDQGQLKPAVNRLGAFINEVNSLIDEGVLTPEEGQPLIDAAQSIIDQIAPGTTPAGDGTGAEDADAAESADKAEGADTADEPGPDPGADNAQPDGNNGDVGKDAGDSSDGEENDGR